MWYFFNVSLRKINYNMGGDFMRLLVIEDEKGISDVIKVRLERENYIVDVTYDGINGYDMVISNIYDLIILDIMLPGKDGFKILKDIRNNGINSKVILLTAKNMIEDKLCGFELGANDYLTKPFHIDELVARVNVQLRNDTNIVKDIIEVGDIQLDLKKLILSNINNQESIEIIGKEFLLLEYLMKNNKQVVSKEQIYDKIWGIDSEIESNNLEAYLSFIRKKLRLIDSNVNIKAIRGMGYRLEVLNEKIK